MTTAQEDDAAPTTVDVHDFLASKIFSILARCSIPLAPFQIRALLVRDHRGCPEERMVCDLEDHHIGKQCRYLEQSSNVLGSWCGSYFLNVRLREMVRNTLITPEYQTIGMTIMWDYNKTTVVYVPPDAEHRFLEARESTIASAGYGLFVRSSRQLRQGTVLCEYSGRAVGAPPRDVALCPYMVELTVADANGNRFIDGVDNEGNVLCLAALINDRGTDGANAEFVEYEGLSGRVFITAMRDLQPGEEIFVSYGQSYWEEQLRERRVPGRKRCRVEAPLQRCRKCSSMMPKRVLKLHASGCQDPLNKLKVGELDPLPRNEFTAFDDQMMASQRFRLDGRLLARRSMMFVDPLDSATFANTHIDVIQWHRVEVIDDPIVVVD